MLPSGLNRLFSMFQRILQGVVVTTSGLELEQPEDATSSSGATSMKGRQAGDVSHTDSSSSYEQVMMTGITTLEEQVVSLLKVIEDMAKQMQLQSEALSNMAGKMQEHEQHQQVVEATLRTILPQEAPNTLKDAPETQLAPPCQASSMPQRQPTKATNAPVVLADGMVSAPQLREFILGAIKDNQDKVIPSYSYVKPYTSRINQLKMPHGYQPPKFQRFNGVGNPKQHITHFVETCNNVGTNRNHMIKQFVLSLKGNAFEWYIELEPATINSWTHLECEFLARFFITQRTVSMIKLTNARQRIDEPVTDFINR
ncbi:hypothetical protein LIER_13357 [Lithospermum erythrorhizon]|uniref:Retrotransposon gag domain-containing protein n=1 Tax=Lithospermum erythrorhizon TaxID=34254 RepID=A0AAV3PW00_LITER